MTTIALTSAVTPAWAITESDCTGIYGGITAEEGGARVCRFPLYDEQALETCDGMAGFPMPDFSECVAPMDEPSTAPQPSNEDSQELAG